MRVGQAERAGPFGRIGHRQVGIVGRVAYAVAGEIGEEVVEPGVEIADRRVEREAAPDRPVRLDLEALDAGRRGVDDDGFVEAAAGEALHAGLHVGIGVGEGREIEPQPALVQRHLEAGFVGVDILRIIGADGGGRRRAAVIAAAAEALLPLGVEQNVVVEGVGDAELGREIVPALLEGGRADRAERIVGERLLFVAVAPARREDELFGHVVIELAEDGVGRVVLAGELNQRAAAIDEARLGVRDVVVLIEKERADDVVERPVAVGGEAQLLAELPVRLVAQRLEEGERAGVIVGEDAILELAIAGDRGERAGAEVPVHLQRGAPGVEVGENRRAAIDDARIAAGRREAGIGVDLSGKRGVAERGARAALLIDVENQRRVEILGRRVGEGEAAGERFAVAFLDAARRVPRIAVIGLVEQRDAAGEIGADREVHREPRLAPAMIADRAHRLAAERSVGALGAHRDHAADRVAAVERALGPAQNLDRGDVEEILQRAGVARQIDAVHFDADRRLERGFHVGEAKAAHVEGAGVRIGADRRENDVRRFGVEIGEALRRLVFQRLRGEGGHRKRDVLQALFALLRGDDDFLAGIVGVACRRGGLSESQSRQAQQGRRRHECARART